MTLTINIIKEKLLSGSERLEYESPNETGALGKHREREREKGGETVKGEFESRTSTTELAHQPTGSQSTEHVI